MLETPGIWRLARALAKPTDQSLAGWFPILATAAILMRTEVTPAELEVAVEWLTANADELGRGRIMAIGRNALELPIEQISVRHQTTLRDLMLRSDGADLAEEIEQILANDLLRRFGIGEVVAESIVLRTDAGREVASTASARILHTATAMLAARLLGWALRAQVPLGSTALAEAGRTVVGGLAAGEPLPELREVATDSQDLRRGIVDAIAGLPPQLQAKVLDHGVMGVFATEDFQPQPAVGEQWLLGAAAMGRMSRIDALAGIVWLRKPGADWHVDHYLIRMLWQGRPWTMSEGCEAIAKLPADELGGNAIGLEFWRQLRQVPDDIGIREWMILVADLASLPAGTLSEDLRAEAEVWAQIADPMLRAITNPGAVLEAVSELLEIYETGRPDLRRFLDLQLPRLLVGHVRPGPVLARCPEPLLEEFCRQSRSAVAGDLSIAEAARLFVISVDLEEARERKKARVFDKLVLRPLLGKWRRRRVNALAKEVNDAVPNGAVRVMMWYHPQQPPRGSEMAHAISQGKVR